MVSNVLNRLTPSSAYIPDQYRSIFSFLYWDVAWFAITAGSSLAFLSIYAARLGATPLQLGMLNAGPAAVALLFTLPVGHWLQHHHIGRAVFWAAFLGRINMLLWVFIPILLPEDIQVQTFILIVLVMSVPGTALMVGFNALYAAAVPMEFRGHVAGYRNAIMSLIYIITSLSCGFILSRTPIEVGYPIVFAVGFVGAMLSTLQLWKLRHTSTTTITEPQKIRGLIGDQARPADVRMSGMAMRANVGLRAFTRGKNLLRAEVLRGSYGRILAGLFAFHFAQFLPIPIMPLFWVDELHFTDGEIGAGTAIFHLFVLLGSLHMARSSKRWLNRDMSAVGALVLSLFPLMTVFTPNFFVFAVTNVIGGIGWAIVAGALGNYLLENVPETNRPPYLAWYNLALNAAILVGSLGGSFMGERLGLEVSLIIAFVLRAASGVAIWRWR